MRGQKLAPGATPAKPVTSRPKLPPLDSGGKGYLMSDTSYSLGYEFGLICGLIKAGHPEIHMHVRTSNLGVIMREAVQNGYKYMSEPTANDCVYYIELVKDI